MASNIPINEAVVLKYNDMKQKKTYGYLVLKIKDEEVVIDEEGAAFPKDCSPSENKEVFLELTSRLAAKPEEPRYVVFDFKMEGKDGRREVIAFINWCSDNCNIKIKMPHGSTKDSVKKKFQGVSARDFHASEPSELQDYDGFVKDLLKAK